MKASYKLRSPYSEKSAVYLFVIHGAKLQKKFGINITTNTAEWDPTKQRISEKSLNKDKNVRLEEIMVKVRRIIAHQELDGNIDFNKVCAEIQDFLHPKQKEEKDFPLTNGILNFIDYRTKHNDLPETSAIKLTSLYNDVSAIGDIRISRISPEFINKLGKYYLSRNLSHSTISRKFKTLRQVFKFLLTQNTSLPSNALFITKSPVKSTTTTKIALTREELRLLHNLTIEGNEILVDSDNYLISPLENARRILLILCYSGVRHSDLEKITLENIINDKIEIMQTKTKHLATIPVTPQLREVLELPGRIKYISNQKLNFYIKQVVRIAGITNKIQFTKAIGGKQVINVKEKCDLVSTHTGRATFITLAGLRGINTQIRMQATGHRSERENQRYIKEMPEVVTKEFLGNNPF